MAKENTVSAIKILVVDDEKHIRMLYQDEFESEGYEVATSDGHEPILEVVSREKPNVVVLDIRIEPDISGLDLLQAIRANEGTQTLPVILSTAYDSFQYDLKSIAADQYVVKSVDLTELKAKVKALVMKKS